MLIINTHDHMVALKGTINGVETHIHLNPGKNRVSDNFVADELALRRFSKLRVDTSAKFTNPHVSADQVAAKKPVSAPSVPQVSEEARGNLLHASVK